ncbi:DEAD/DEAH box helicase [Gryllotalpicola ginsengisoli]|uniref:DEAD/DEAH box helicase n=1 Tax=Gryllotalpicola ginsengisoli TaxID=444608 RepID=UPI0004888C58|nr:ATP-binding protein [Gryllotalpicola ginsengisoli]
MWGIERKSAPGGATADSARDDALNPPLQTGAAPALLTTGDPSVQVGNVAEHAWTKWRREIASLGGRSPLLHFSDEPRTRIELTSTHPGGMPTFITGERTLLSSLIRDELALRNARVAASAITNKGIELRSVRGIDAVHLAVGLAAWRFDGDEFLAPVLLRPLAIRRYGRDFELKLRGKPFLNPELARALKAQFDIALDPEELAGLAHGSGAFKPQPVIDRLRALTAELPWFKVQPRLVVSSFADVAGTMLADAARLQHPMLDALAGNPAARAQIEAAYEPAPLTGQDARPPAMDTLLLDSDEQQDAVVAQIAAGNSIIVKTLPGTGGTQTIVNALGALVAKNKRVLVASPRRSSLDGIAFRLAQVGLEGVAVRPETLRRDLITAIARNEKAEQPHVAEVDDALVRLRKVLLDYRGALTHKDPQLGVSVLDALEELARLALLPTPPATTARLDLPSLRAIAHSRREAAQTLVKAARLGEFRYGPDDSPWYGAHFHTPADGEAAHELAKKLHAVELPRLIERAQKLVASTKLRPFENIAELGVYLRLLADLRETLDKFQPSVFDRPLTELVNATSGRRDVGMSAGDRRRLRKLAHEYVRPGVHVGDMHESLLKIQQQRTLWQRYAEAGAPPAVPVGIADVQVAYQRVASDLASLDEPLARAGTPASLTLLPLSQLKAQIAGLAADSEVLANLQQRTELIQQLREVNLDPLLADLGARHVKEAQIPAELELAWWQSVLEHMLSDDRALLGGNTSVLDRLEADFRLVDEAHASSTARQLAWQLAEAWRIGVVDNPDEADALKRLLRGDRVTAPALTRAAPRLGRMLAPVWLASPYTVAQLPDDLDFDAVFIVDAGACTLPENIGVIRRARQLVAFGDPVTQTPTPFETAVAESAETSHEVDVDALHGSSTLARLTDLLPVFTLTRSYRAGGDDLAELVNRRFYGGKIETLPWAGTYLGHGSLNLHLVKEGFGLPDPDSGAVESVDAEVAKVLELVVDHAVNRPRESLMVVTASPRHAVRVHQAVLRVFGQRQDLTDFILADKAEPFTVVTLDQATAQSRDRVIFSIGYGRTPHGRLLSNLGALAAPGGERLLAVGLTRARRSLDIVSCFRPDDIDDQRMPHGMVALAHVLAEAADMDASLPDAPETTEPLLVDLKTRLERRGLSVRLGYRGALPLVASYGTKAVVVETDQIVGQGSLRESLRLRPELLRRLGWHYLRVHSFELFADPEAIAARVARLIGAADQSAPETAPITLP